MLIEHNTKRAMQNINEAHKKGIKTLRNQCDDLIKNSRCVGTVAAFDINTNKDLNKRLKAEFLKKGLLLRPLEYSLFFVIRSHVIAK